MGGPSVCRRRGRALESFAVTGLARLLVLVAVVVVLFVVGGSAVLAKVPDLRDKAADLVGTDESATRQGAAQLSTAEFANIRPGITPARLRGLVGEPESGSSTSVEGLEIECWYYGIVAETGSFQFCFANGKLTSRFRYAR